MISRVVLSYFDEEQEQGSCFSQAPTLYMHTRDMGHACYQTKTLIDPIWVQITNWQAPPKEPSLNSSCERRLETMSCLLRWLLQRVLISCFIESEGEVFKRELTSSKEAFCTAFGYRLVN